MLLSSRYWQKCDFFLSKKKTMFGLRQLGSVCSDLLHKNDFGSFSFFDLRNTFCIKDTAIFGLFSEKTGVFIAKDTKNKVRRIFDS